MISTGDEATEHKYIAEEISNVHSVNMDPGSSSSVEPRVILTTPRRTLQNLYIISFSYFLFFVGFWSLSNLQSTMNAKQGMGPDSQAVIYLCSMISCFLPQLLIEKFGSKKTLLIALLASCPYIAANFHLRWDILMTTSVLFGMFNGPLNAAIALYIDEMATRYKASNDESKENVKALFFGINMIFTESTQVFGNGISYLALNKGKYEPLQLNSSSQYNCGVHFNPEAANGTNDNLTPPSEHSRLILTGIFLLLSVLAVLFTLALDPLKNDVKNIQSCDTVTKTFFAFVKLLRNPHQLLLIPLSIFCGIESAFYANDFTEAFIACSWGVHHVGFVTICFGVCGALMAILVGPLVKCVSQMSVIILAALMNVTMCTLLFLWQPSPDAPWAYFVFAGAWGMTDAIWWSQVAALYGLMFPNDREAAFSNFFFWSFLGYFLSYSYANYLTVAVKINIMLVFLIIGITLYVIGQIRIKCASRSGYVVIGDSE